MIRVTDVGSKVILQTEITKSNTQPKFKKLYVRYNAQKVGFLGGVGLDGCHLKGKFGGHILLSTIRDWNDNIFPVVLAVVEQENKDWNDNIFPVVLAVVEQENKDYWGWFLQIFADDIGRPDELNLEFISERQKVIQFTCFLRFLFVLSHYIFAF